MSAGLVGLIAIVIIISHALVGFAMYIMYKTLKDTRNNDLDLVRKFSDMLLAGDFKTYESFRGYNERIIETSKNVRKKVDEEPMAIDNISNNL